MKYTARQLFDKEQYSVCKVSTYGGTGTRYIVNLSEGIIITNAHVIGRQGGGVYDSCTVEIGSQSSNASVLAYGQSVSATDFAILRAWNLPSYATEVKLRHGYLPDHGENIFIIGHPLGASLTITQGIVNNPEYTMGGQTFILTDTTINPGNSGGPMFDEEGYVIGTAVAKINKEHVDNQNFILSMKQYADFISASGIDINGGPYPSSPKEVRTWGSYTQPTPPSGGFGSNPYGQNPYGGNPFGGMPQSPYQPGMMVNMPGPYGYPVPMVVSANVAMSGNTYVVLRMATAPGFYLYMLMPNGTLMPVMDQNLTAYVVNYCMSQGILR
jgi:V8-like Glu-specific endopeptidase